MYESLITPQVVAKELARLKLELDHVQNCIVSALYAPNRSAALHLMQPDDACDPDCLQNAISYGALYSPTFCDTPMLMQPDDETSD